MMVRVLVLFGMLAISLPAFAVLGPDGVSAPTKNGFSGNVAIAVNGESSEAEESSRTDTSVSLDWAYPEKANTVKIGIETFWDGTSTTVDQQYKWHAGYMVTNTIGVEPLVDINFNPITIKNLYAIGLYHYVNKTDTTNNIIGYGIYLETFTDAAAVESNIFRYSGYYARRQSFNEGITKGLYKLQLDVDVLNSANYIIRHVIGLESKISKNLSVLTELEVEHGSVNTESHKYSSKLKYRF